MHVTRHDFITICLRFAEAYDIMLLIEVAVLLLAVTSGTADEVDIEARITSPVGSGRDEWLAELQTNGV